MKKRGESKNIGGKELLAVRKDKLPTRPFRECSVGLRSIASPFYNLQSKLSPSVC